MDKQAIAALTLTVNEQGQAIRNTTLILERIVDFLGEAVAASEPDLTNETVDSESGS